VPPSLPSVILQRHVPAIQIGKKPKCCKRHDRYRGNVAAGGASLTKFKHDHVS
jgi:hypothetical protein